MNFDRRSFLLGAGSLAALSTSPLRFVRAQSLLDSSSLLSVLDMEVADFATYESPGSSVMAWRPSGNSPVISTEQSRSGSRAARIYLNRLTSRVSFRTEAESVHTYGRLEYFKTYWIGFSIYVPSDWRQGSTVGETMFQVHNAPDDWANSKSPIVAIRYAPNTNPGKWLLRVNYILTPESENPGNTGIQSAIRNSEHTIEIGRWSDWVLEYRPDYRLRSEGGDGLTRMWLNGMKVVDYQGPCAFNENNGPYLKFGTYKGSWKDRDINDPVVDRLYYFDELRVARPGEGSFDMVTPGGPTSLASPNPPGIIIE